MRPNHREDTPTIARRGDLAVGMAGTTHRGINLSILDEIVDYKRGEIAAAQQRTPWDTLQTQLADAPPIRDFHAALNTAAPMHVIAEVKKASPSAGLISEDFDAVAIAQVYEQHGAACISVLTDEHFFQGHLDYLRAVRQAVGIPVLRKDFILDRYQVLEARVAGADCILLIAECLDPDTLADLYHYANSLGMSCLVELYEPENLECVLSVKPKIVGVNNRDLRTFQTDLGHSLTLHQQVDSETIFVSESGIRCRDDVVRLEQAGVDAILVGETLMRSADIGAALGSLLGKNAQA
ncbi:Indole-3-glycerol phosphate synthase [Symmachiella dynata]|nr:Indole-3-glycerol phosphate synthase [Symmachiella dynata]